MARGPYSLIQELLKIKIMKKLLSLFALLSFSLGSINAQMATVEVLDSANPVGGVTVFFYDSPTAWNNNTFPISSLSKDFTTFESTDANGEARFFIGNLANLDTFYYATKDCNGQIAWGAATPASINPGSNLQLPISCPPSACEAMVTVDTISGFLYIQGIAYRDSAYTTIPNNRVLHTYLINNRFYRSRLNVDPNYDTIMEPLRNISGNTITACYSRVDSLCAFTCDSIVLSSGGGGNPISCQANWFVDSVNSGRFQGQIILGENSTTSAGRIINWSWDFGDGTVINSRYPSHTYATTFGVYNVCLSVTAVAGNDTCVSTYCDSVGFDANGNLVFKNGANMTINVVDPATFSTTEFDLNSEFTLYPNPAKGPATLEWSEAVNVEELRVLSLNGQLMQHRSVSEAKRSLSIEALRPGMYLLEIRSSEGPLSLRLIVE